MISSAPEEIRQKVVLSEWIGRWVRLQRKGQDFWGLCPFHHEKSPSFSVSNTRGFYHCFGCGAHGDIFSFLMHIQKTSFPETLAQLAETLGVSLPHTPGAARGDEHRARPVLEALKLAHLWFAEQWALPEARLAAHYLDERRIPAAWRQTFGLGYAPEGRQGLVQALLKKGVSLEVMTEAGLAVTGEDSPPRDRFRKRIMFPIFHAKGHVIAFGGRAMGDHQPKYMNSPETPVFHKGHTLYNLHTLTRTAPSGAPLLVVEGYLDVIRVHQSGWPRVVAPLGTALTPDHLALLWQHDPEPVLVMDGDPAGRKAVDRILLRALPLLQPGKSLQVVWLPEGEDPDSLLANQPPEVFRECLERAQPLVDVLETRFFTEQDRSTPERWALARKNLMDAVQTVSHPDIQALYRHRFEERLEALARPVRPRNRPRPSEGSSRQATPALRPGPDPLESRLLLLAGMALAHPRIVLETSEQLLSLPCPDKRLQDLFSALLQHMEGHPEATPADTGSVLHQKGYGPIMARIRKHMDIHGNFVARLATPEDVLSAWVDIANTVPLKRLPRRSPFPASVPSGPV